MYNLCLFCLNGMDSYLRFTLKKKVLKKTFLKEGKITISGKFAKGLITAIDQKWPVFKLKLNRSQLYESDV